jgi:hypothetical protein
LLANFWYTSEIFLSLASIRGRWRSCFCRGPFFFAGEFILSLVTVFFAGGFVLSLATFFFLLV